jgi:uncharacterized membrane protein
MGISHLRYWEIDAIRGLAVLLMIAYHAIFDITYFGSGSVPINFAYAVASIFILTSGISLSISYSRASRFAKFAKRGIKLLVVGFVITGVSYMLLREGVIVFGVIHFFGVTSFLIYFVLRFVKSKWIFLLLGILVIASGIVVNDFIAENNYFVWLGLKTANFFTFDYFPLLPWFGVMLLGVFLGKTFYPSGKRGFKIFEIKGIPASIVTFLGKHSLAIYIIHQPIILIALAALGYGQFLYVFNF